MYTICRLGKNIPLTQIKHPGSILGPNQLNKVHQNSRQALAIKKLVDETKKWELIGCRAMNCDIGPYGAGNGHVEFTGDCMQCYRYVLLWLTHTRSDVDKSKLYVNGAVSILTKWCTTCTSFTGLNAPLEIAWGTNALIRSAEILKYKWSGWSREIETKVNAFLTNVALPNLKKRFVEISLWNNNWILTILEALMQIAIFQNNIIDFQWAIDQYAKLWPFVGMSQSKSHCGRMEDNM